MRQIKEKREFNLRANPAFVEECGCVSWNPQKVDRQAPGKLESKATLWPSIARLF